MWTNAWSQRLRNDWAPTGVLAHIGTGLRRQTGCLLSFRLMLHGPFLHSVCDKERTARWMGRPVIRLSETAPAHHVGRRQHLYYKIDSTN